MMRKIKYQCSSLLLLTLLTIVFFSCDALAGSFKVNPLKLEFGTGKKSTVLDVRNTSDREITVQIETRQWTQGVSGEDLYEETKDLVFFPRIVTLKPGEKRVVRVAFQGKRSEKTELSYRLFVQELLDRSQEKNTLSFALRLSIPVFVQGTSSHNEIKLSSAVVEKGKAKITLNNVGDNHVMVNHLQLTGLNENQRELFFHEEKGWYVLPGAENRFELALSQQECDAASRLELAAQTTVKTVVAHIQKENIHCQ